MQSPEPDALQGDVAGRLTELEIKLSFTEDLVEELNRTVYQQQLAIEQLQRALHAVRLQVGSQSGGPPPSLRDEIPPHY